MRPRRPGFRTLARILSLAITALLSPSVLAEGLTPGRPGDRKDASDERKPKPRAAWTAPDPAGEEALEPRPIAVVGADIHPVVGSVVERGTLLLEHGRIAAILREDARIPARFQVIDAHGLQAWPGYVACGADGLGLAEDAWAGGQEAQLGRGVGESFDPWSVQVELAASAGITSAFTWRAAFEARGPIIGRAAVLKMSVREPRGATLRDLAGVLAGPALLSPAGRAAARELIRKAREGDLKDPGTGDLWRALAARDVPLVSAADDAAQILSTAELAEELDLRLLLVTPAEAWPLAARLAEGDVAVVQNVRHSWSRASENRRAQLPGGWRFDAATLLMRAGVPTAISTESPRLFMAGIAGRNLLDLPIEAAYAVRAGFTDAQAVEAITIVPARILGVDDRIGSIEPGKDADIILLDGDPLDYRTLVRTTIVNGRVAYRAEESARWHGVLERRERALVDKSQQP